MENIEKLFQSQKEYFFSGKTRSLEFRIEQLKKLKRAVKQYEDEIMKAVQKDLGKSEFEVYMTELSQFYLEINEMIRKCGKWTKSRRKNVPLVYFPGRAKIVKEPYGVVLLIGPFNYPVGLILQPLIGAIASGNCIMIKPSEYSMNLTAVLKNIMMEIYNPAYVTVCNPESGHEIVNQLLDLPFDYIFFTGSVRTGKVIMSRASKHLTPITLELGGKSPCIIDKTADVKLAARKVAWGKLINGGQTCIAPDYVLVHKSLKDIFLKELVREIEQQYGKDPKINMEYCRIVNEQAVKRLVSYMEDGTIYFGGQYDIEERFVAPTILVDVNQGSKVMEEEIFGPVLPVMEYEDLKNEVRVLQNKHKPLALYMFARDKKNIGYVLSKISSGGVCINDTIYHAACSSIPFGGIGNSGMGAYHGKYSIDTFTHSKAVYTGGSRIDLPFRYAPYGDKIKILKMFVK